jgi:hypothetical protein
MEIPPPMKAGREGMSFVEEERQDLTADRVEVLVMRVAS